MRVTTVRRTAAGFGLALLVCAALAAWLAPTPRRGPPAVAPSPPTTLSGAELWARHCAGCHEVEDLAPQLRGEHGAARALEWLSFLEAHAEGDAGEDRAVLAFLAGQTD
ncbi:MAG: cytochrome c [Planctomycetes bacterium]|nr:cytochrome c [Planctomycetota bacterium]